MLSSKSFLCIDFGAGSLKVAEFDLNEAGGLRLLKYAVKSLGLAGSQDAAREGVVQRGLQELSSGKAFAAKRCSVCAPGFHVFSKFIKLPQADSSKIKQIIQYEAQQNVPFPLEEVVWDYQILGSLPSGELEVLLVAIKSDIVESLFKVTESSGLRLDLVDVSPAALCNAFRFNYGDLEGCTMLLDIGAKTSNVLFFEKGKVYARSINIGANSITQDFAVEGKMPFAEAEKVKIAEGFVSLGGAYEEPDNPRQAAISKIARQVMTRLHIQVNQTIQFYRSQQGGSAPQRVFLAGGASIMAYTAQFFAEKLNVPVEYFNPFRNIQIDPSVNLEELAKVAHAFGEVVGLGLRNPTQCPVELNLIPKSILQQQQLNQRKPYFVATVVSLILVVFAMGWYFDKVANVKQGTIDDRTPNVSVLKDKATQLESALAAKKRTEEMANQYTEWMQSRFTWANIIAELGRALKRVETAMSREGGARAGLWVEKLMPEGVEPAETEAKEEGDTSPRPKMDIRMMMRYGLLPKNFNPAMLAGAGDAAEGDGAKPKQEKNTNEIQVINLTFKAVSWNKVFADADSRLAIQLEKELLNSPIFAGGTNGTQLSGKMEQDEATQTFTFDVRLKLAKPIKL